MLLDLAHLNRKLGLDVRGIVHVGAHLGQEYETYREQFPDQVITWIEADPVVHERLVRRMRHKRNVSCLNAVVSDVRETVTFNRASNEQSSSLLPLGTHSEVHPNVHYVDSFSAETVTLDELARSHGFSRSNFLAIDVQGAEGKVIAGARQFLQGVDYIYSEVNRDELYLGCTTLGAFEDMLWEQGFARAALKIQKRSGWGDGFYVRRTLVSRHRDLLNRFRRAI